MELEVGIKIIKTKENLTSTDIRIAKDRAGPVFFSRETENMFVLTVHLKGFKRERIKIDISEDKTRISLSGEKPVQEMVMKRWIMTKKEVEIKGFRKVFKIPEGVIVDKIKAKYNEKDAILAIFMPKLTAGIRGIGIEEVKEQGNEAESSETIIAAAPPVPAAEVSEALQPELKQPDITEDREEVEETKLKSPEIERETITPTGSIEFPLAAEPVGETIQPNEVQPEEIQHEQPLILPDEPQHEEIAEAENTMHEQQSEEPMKVEPEHRDIQNGDLHPEEFTQEKKEENKEPEPPETEALQDQSPETNEAMELKLDGKAQKEEKLDEDHLETVKQTEIQDEKNVVDQIGPTEEADVIEAERENRDERNKVEGTIRRKYRLCGPCIFAGSAFIGFLVVLVMQLMKNHKNSKK
ncbi:hypothetical protein AQUCO_02300146v1 [Aquilegia coerulea]|uniref:SHSP domain-containing protein n=1 Tax=Aquilegia coerulea TaxID=218851 RepID=A0A2G5DCC9_AQUCA|nr:hypothetical protein AQUCO_02300146v1 [Aquilegia coerulea]